MVDRREAPGSMRQQHCQSVLRQRPLASRTCAKSTGATTDEEHRQAGGGVTTYTINICPECGEQEIEDREGDPICPRHGWNVDWEEIEVVPVSDREYLDSVIAESKQRLARIMDLEDALREIA